MTKGKRGTRRKGRTGRTYAAKPGDLRDHSWASPVVVTTKPLDGVPLTGGASQSGSGAQMATQAGAADLAAESVEEQPARPTV